MKKLKNEKGMVWEKVKKQDGLSAIIVNYSDKIMSYLHVRCSIRSLVNAIDLVL